MPPGHTRRSVLAAVGTGAVVPAGVVTAEQTGEPIELGDVEWSIEDLGNPEVEVTIRNNTDDEVTVNAIIRVFADDVLLDDGSPWFDDVPPGVETAEERSFFDLERDDLGDVTHWTIEIEEGFEFDDPYEARYEFEGPIEPGATIDVEGAEFERES